MPPKKPEESNRFVLGATLTAILIFFSSKGQMWRGDTPDYLRYSCFHPPLYSLLLMSFNAIAGRMIGLYAVLVLQIGSILLASLHFCLFLRRCHGLNRLLSVAAFAVLISPLCAYYGNYLIADAFAYVFFLMFMSHLGRWLSCPDRKDYIPAGIFMVLARLTRSDMTFLCLPYTAAGLYVFCRSRDRKVLKRAAAVLAAAFLTANILVRSCNYIFIGNFSLEPLFGIQTLANCVYVSDVGDARLYKGGPYYDAMRQLFEDADRQKLLSKYKFALDETLAVHNGRSLMDLVHLAMTAGADLAGEGKNRQPQEIPRYDLPAVNRICLAASWPLLRSNGRQLSRLVLSRMWKGMSCFEGMIVMILGVLPFLFAAEPLAMLLALFALCHLSHTLLVATLTMVIGRYTFYTYLLMLIAPLLLLQRALSARSSQGRY